MERSRTAQPGTDENEDPDPALSDWPLQFSEAPEETWYHDVPASPQQHGFPMEVPFAYPPLYTGAYPPDINFPTSPESFPRYPPRPSTGVESSTVYMNHPAPEDSPHQHNSSSQTTCATEPEFGYETGDPSRLLQSAISPPKRSRKKPKDPVGRRGRYMCTNCRVAKRGWKVIFAQDKPINQSSASLWTDPMNHRRARSALNVEFHVMDASGHLSGKHVNRKRIDLLLCMTISTLEL